ncbi:MAG: RdgB/HAM1 family non-canonical purine NTP pyrophosphatase [Cyanobacteria bacterium]|nr:RdgB/HAM1 family non-canonical purine NTP pyrophosphatase [Cyanobacteriota bacterium]
MKLVLATQNPGKLRELEEIARYTMQGVGSVDGAWLELVLAPPGFDPIESGDTYEENALIKAKEAAILTKTISVADDSGLEVEALKWAPGVHSARYCEGDDRARREKLLTALQGVDEIHRAARFVCHMVVYDPISDGVVYKAHGIWNGRIGQTERGSGGFGYDPIFYLPERDVTAAEIPSDEKNLNSHRGIAWRKVLDFLKKTFMPR